MSALSGRTTLASTTGGDSEWARLIPVQTRTPQQPPSPTSAVVIISGDQFGPLSVAASGYSAVPLLSISYGKPSDATLRYTAVACAVTTAHTTITCQTTQGTGYGLIWQVGVAGQSSARLTTFTTAYAPPVIALFSGPGSLLARTSGYETVAVTGADAVVLPSSLRRLLPRSSLRGRPFRRGQLRPRRHQRRLRRVQRQQRDNACVARLRARDAAHAHLVQHVRRGGDGPELDHHD